MTAAQIGTLCILLAGTAMVTALVLAGGAALARLWFPARIQAIRGDAVAAILNRTLRQAPAVTAWLAELDDRTRAARPGLPAVRLHPESGHLTPDGQDIITGLANRTRAAVRAFLIWGQPPSSLLLHLARIVPRRRR